MSYRQKVHRLAEQLGATIEGGRSGDTYQYNIDAPRHHTWASDYGLHCIVAWCYVGPKEWTEEMWKDALDRMEYGVEPCEIEDCDMCNDDENWPAS